MAYGDTYFSLGWGHLEARLQTAFVQVQNIIINNIIQEIKFTVCSLVGQ